MKPIEPTKLPILRPFEVIIWGEGRDRPLDSVSVQAFSDDEAKADAISHFRMRWAASHQHDLSPVPKISRIDVCDGIRFTPAQRQRGLFEDLADCCLGEAMDDVQGAAVNLLLTAVQRSAKNQADAETRWDGLMGRGKQALIRRYRGDTDHRDVAAESEIAKKLFA